jgi:transposase-like protein
MPMARPTKYNQEMQDKADEYLNDYFNIRPEAPDFQNENEMCVIPSIEGLAEYLGVSRKSLYNWREQHPEFLHTLEAIEEKQKNLLINNGLKGKFNSNIAKLMLVNHGIHEKKEVVVADDDERTPAERDEALARKIVFALAKWDEEQEDE